MKWMMLLFLAFPIAHTNAQTKKAQMQGQTLQLKQNDAINKLITSIPMQSGVPYYDTAVESADGLTRDELQENADYFFSNIFGTGYVNRNQKHGKMTAIGKYNLTTSKNADPDDVYTVNYLMDITVKNGRYDVSLHSFTIEHQGAEIDMAVKMDAAVKNDQKARIMLACFQQNNINELRKVYAVMARKPSPSMATASK